MINLRLAHIAKAVPLALACIFGSVLASQEYRRHSLRSDTVAVMEPTGDSNVTKANKIIVQRALEKYLSKVDSGYRVLDTKTLEKTMEKMNIQRSGLVKESDVIELAGKAGATHVAVSTIVTDGSDLVITIDIIDLKTAKKILSDYVIAKSNDNRAFSEACEGLVAKMLGIRTDEEMEKQRQEKEARLKSSRETYSNLLSGLGKGLESASLAQGSQESFTGTVPDTDIKYNCETKKNGVGASILFFTEGLGSASKNYAIITWELEDAQNLQNPKGVITVKGQTQTRVEIAAIRFGSIKLGKLRATAELL